jgi:hypothetical protein
MRSRSAFAPANRAWEFIVVRLGWCQGWCQLSKMRLRTESQLGCPMNTPDTYPISEAERRGSGGQAPADVEVRQCPTHYESLEVVAHNHPREVQYGACRRHD